MQTESTPGVHSTALGDKDVVYLRGTYAVKAISILSVCAVKKILGRPVQQIRLDWRPGGGRQAGGEFNNGGLIRDAAEIKAEGAGLYSQVGIIQDLGQHRHTKHHSVAIDSAAGRRAEKCTTAQDKFRIALTAVYRVELFQNGKIRSIGLHYENGAFVRNPACRRGSVEGAAIKQQGVARKRTVAVRKIVQ